MRASFRVGTLVSVCLAYLHMYVRASVCIVSVYVCTYEYVRRSLAR